MAISYTHYQLMQRLRPLLPRGGSLLEIGEANWYGDINPREILNIDGTDKVSVPTWALEAIVARNPNFFTIAKAFYEVLFAPSLIHAVDINGSPQALRQDLNAPLQLTHRYDVSINHGTAEHIFNIGQVFRTMHDWTKPGGLMIHECPCTGWLDHGFYTLQPTLFYDLAASNGYTIELIAIEEVRDKLIIELERREHFAELANSGRLPLNTMLFVALRRGHGGAFRVPMQGYYDQRLSEAGNKAWETMR